MSEWQKNLDGFFKKTEQKKKDTRQTEMAHFIATVAIPAFAEIREELEKHGRDVTIRNAEVTAGLIVTKDGEEEITYRVQSRSYPNTVVPYAEVRTRERKGLKLVRNESMFRSGAPDYAIKDIGKDEIIQNFLSHYMRLIGNE